MTKINDTAMTASHGPFETSVITLCPEHVVRTGPRPLSFLDEIKACPRCTRTVRGHICAECDIPWPCHQAGNAAKLGGES